MTMKLWLDDERPEPEDWSRATSAGEAIKYLTWCRCEEISLDHDLGDPKNGTGYDVLLWLEQRAKTGEGYVPDAIHVHTANPVAKARMLQAVESIMRLREEAATCPHGKKILDP